jgi:hypothetical protein
MMNDYEIDKQVAAAERRALSLPYRDACERCDCEDPDEPKMDKQYKDDVCYCTCHPCNAWGQD